MAETYKWVDKYGGAICNQMRRLGTSCDWSRQAFTMDAKLSAAVKGAFFRMHAQGLIYRDVRLVHWDCRLKTAVSDAEVCTQDRLQSSSKVLKLFLPLITEAWVRVCA